MKIIIIIFLLVSGSLLMAENKPVFLEKDGLLYEEKSGLPFNGTHTIFYEDGSIKEKVSYINGKKEGKRKTFHKNGMVFEDEMYADGKLEDVFRGYYDNGALWWEGTALKNNRHGAIKVLHATGGFKYRGHYEFNLKVGLWEFFDPDGEIEKIECYEDNLIVNPTACNISVSNK